ncbi:MAG: fructose-bisphosphate aldolase class I [Candidatus Scalindua sp. AMX11]|nr:MAG: fructose-bisphosphate aldolase class I [Candidatus Scalindua sp.]NOG84669.1 fructose-bisphosphate aldolase class I [Planctomycetota bacterium]RZV92440.1 MAG: fructose-bisphosphate aldolase class I [Candidatus Scalindua sp. SCAELEC01]TDE66031.1 MAG: fructose-bisphosphate aldolase class I [Candidatus Scalindua sp. AMX11]GJQ59002.1 MAG: fructose-bisphosphate aldolase [Candidatus Scalindua sp.]
MDEEKLQETINKMVIRGRGILAADESEKTAAKRLASINVESTEETRRQYRNLILTTPGMENYISGVILFEETLHQESDSGVLFPEVLQENGIVPGIKVDQGLADLNEGGEKYTKGLEGLGERLQVYKKSGVRFAKWRAVYTISKNRPSAEAIKRNARDLSLYAKICHENGLVPIVEPEVLIDGTHSIEQCYEATENVLRAVFEALKREKVRIDLCLLKPSMVISGKEAVNRADVDEVAKQTIKCLRATVPAELPSINFLSGGQTPIEATAHLNRINMLGEDLPWYISFSFARALQEPALKAWQGKQENVKAGQDAFLKRARLNGLATQGKYREDME